MLNRGYDFPISLSFQPSSIMKEETNVHDLLELVIDANHSAVKVDGS
jgi:hypothetical protein